MVVRLAVAEREAKNNTREIGYYDNANDNLTNHSKNVRHWAKM